MCSLFLSRRACVRARHRQAIAAGMAAIALAAAGASAWADGAIKGFPQFYESRKSKTCPDNVCSMGLTPVPAGALLQATHVSCTINTVAPTPVAVIRVLLLEGPISSAKPKNGFLAHAANPSSNVNVFIFNQEIRSFFAAQNRPIFAASIDTATQVTLDCKLSGSLIRP